MRKDTVQPRKRKTPARGRQKKSKNPKIKSKEDTFTEDLDDLIPGTISSFNNYPGPLSPPAQYSAPWPARGPETGPGMFEEKETYAEDMSSTCVPPGDVSSGMRDYSCSVSDKCRHLRFTRLEGPQSVREHIKLCH